MRTLYPQPLTRENFAPFGEVIETSGSRHFAINGGTTERFHDLAHVDVSESGGRPLISIFRTQPVKRPLTVRLMERHPLASQAFIPLCRSPFLVLVAPAGDTLTAADLQLFQTNGHQGVNYRRNVWHHPVLALASNQEFLVVDRGGEGKNCDEYLLSEEIQIFVT
ncbi:ureidoglycolate lyase [Marinobacterium zhoushanense]|uniref:Ureidoglycolate lyase n=1 Tax=Marinobacterium zhoushanense TaxID=1679163 RepID=A0ABQ1KFU5_9GAMM|nr:ureidoglycolate lyase [Marinobacterium zhoushanense]GGB98831.1 ureidoglycolate lyase [Marinobacterium zhoushanense]